MYRFITLEVGHTPIAMALKEWHAQYPKFYLLILPPRLLKSKKESGSKRYQKNKLKALEEEFFHVKGKEVLCLTPDFYGKVLFSHSTVLKERGNMNRFVK